jgi:hypothetical protein
MALLKLRITKRRDGREIAWFRGEQGRVRTSAGPVSWVRAGQLRLLAEYAIELLLGQCAAGLGADGQPMPSLKESGRAVFLERVGGRARFERRGYAQAKVRLGLQPLRDLRGPGIGGHMLDAIRINYLDDRQATFGITTRLARIKAQANERRAPWWGLSPESVRRLDARAAQVFGAAFEGELVAQGLMSEVSRLAGGLFLARAA